VAEPLQLAAPVVGRAAGLAEDLGGRPRGEERRQGGAGEPAALLHFPRDRGDRDFEHRLGEIDPNLHL
jgi:hypothetical protein